MIGGVITDNIHYRHFAFARVVQVGQAVTQTTTEMEQGGGGFIRHTGIAVGGTGGNAFEQCQHSAHARFAVERGNKVHFAGARVSKTDVDTGIRQGFHQSLCAVWHCYCPRSKNRCAVIHQQ